MVRFIEAGQTPVYIGFGSIVLEDPEAMTTLILEAVQKSNVRALVSKGWGGLGLENFQVPENVFFIENVPHDWLFQHVSCVVHHGGAGTTAAGLALGKPTIIVPFFGDQKFWGTVVASRGAGPPPIPSKLLTADNLSAAIIRALEPDMLENAKELGMRISAENGSLETAKMLQSHLPFGDLRCALLPRRKAVWRLPEYNLKLSSLAAAVLVEEGLIDSRDLRL